MEKGQLTVNIILPGCCEHVCDIHVCKKRQFDIKISIQIYYPEKVKQQQYNVPPFGKSLCPSGVDNQRHIRVEAGKRSGPMKLCD